MATIVKTPQAPGNRHPGRRGWPTTSKTFRLKRDRRLGAACTEDEWCEDIYFSALRQTPHLQKKRSALLDQPRQPNAVDANGERKRHASDVNLEATHSSHHASWLR